MEIHKRPPKRPFVHQPLGWCVQAVSLRSSSVTQNKQQLLPEQLLAGVNHGTD